MEPAEIRREITIDASIEHVWALMTTPEHVAAWYASGGAEIDLRPGGEMRLRWAEHGEFQAVVDVVEPPHRFAFRLAHEPDQAPGPGSATRVELVLEPVGRGTRVLVVETGFATLAIEPEERAAYAEIEGQGWTAGLSALQAHAEGRGPR